MAVVGARAVGTRRLPYRANAAPKRRLSPVKGASQAHTAIDVRGRSCAVHEYGTREPRVRPPRGLYGGVYHDTLAATKAAWAARSHGVRTRCLKRHSG